MAGAGALRHRLGSGHAGRPRPRLPPACLLSRVRQLRPGGTNNPRIPDDLLGWLTQRYDAIFTQDRNARTRQGSGQPLGRIQVTRDLTEGDLNAKLLSGDP